MPRPWYVSGFGAHYLELYAHRNEREAEQALGLLDRAGLAPGERPVLDLACGGGRHLAGLGRRGWRGVGLDLSGPLLDEARGRLRPGLSLVRADMRVLPFRDGSFAGAMSMFTSFGYFARDAENWRMPREVERVLAPGGWFLFDFFNRAQVLQGLLPASRRESAHWIAEEERRVERTDEGDRVVKEVAIRPRDGGEAALRYAESVRLFAPEELRSGFADCGFRVEREWGDYRGADFDESASPRFILLLRRERP